MCGPELRLWTGEKYIKNIIGQLMTFEQTADYRITALNFLISITALQLRRD